MKTWVNYNHLYYFKTVVDAGGINSAAKELGLGGPAISMQVKQLEEVLQTELFDRRKRKLELTESGRIVYDYASHIFALGSEMLGALSDQVEGRTRIRIGIHDTVPKNLISRLTSYIYGQSESKVIVSNGPQEEITSGLLRHDYDLIVLNHPPLVDDKSLLFSKRVLRSPVVLAGSEEFLHLKGKPLTDFSRVPFIMPSPSSVLRQRLEQYCIEREITINSAGETTDTLIQKNMAISGNGVIPIMKEAITSYVLDKKLYILQELSELQDEIWFVSGNRKISNPVTAKLMNDFKF